MNASATCRFTDPIIQLHRWMQGATQLRQIIGNDVGVLCAFNGEWSSIASMLMYSDSHHLRALTILTASVR